MLWLSLACKAKPHTAEGGGEKEGKKEKKEGEKGGKKVKKKKERDLKKKKKFQKILK